MRKINALSITLAVMFCGCDLQRMALDQTAGILKQAMPAFEKEWDHELAAAALPGNIKMMEGFLQAGPDNRDLLMMTSQAYTSYGLIVLEDAWEQAIQDEEMEDTSRATKLAQRTREMYMRGHRYAMRLLELDHPGITEAIGKGLKDLEPFLKRCTKEHVPGLFWAGMPLATAINMSRDDVSMIALIPKAKAIIGRVLELDEAYYHAGSHMIYGGIYGGVSKMLGGDPDKAKKHFEKGLTLTKRGFLLVQVMYAKTLAVQTQNQKLFDSLLDEVLKAKLEINPEQKLANVAAKRKARRLLAKKDELF